MTRAQFRCPASMQPHARKVLAGEYDVPGFNHQVPVIFDIGANVGAFSVWALQRWPGARITGWEPHPENVTLYRANLGQHAHVVEAAVFADGTLQLWEGQHNCGEHSLWCGPEQGATRIEVEGHSPSQLGPCDFLKLDTEGAELAILAGYRHLATVQAVALETHSRRDAKVIRCLLEHEGLTLVSEDEWRADRSVQKWLREA